MKMFDQSEYVAEPFEGADPSATEPRKLRWLDMSQWDDKPAPPREWAVFNRIPLRQAGLLSGEGGAGKSLVELTKDAAHVLAKEWFGSTPKQGPAFYLGYEDEGDEIHRRLEAICRHYDVKFKDLIAGGLRVISLLGQDLPLCVANGKSGRVEATPFYKELYEAAGDLKPVSISIDTLSRAFIGSELDRNQVYGYANLMQALAQVSNGSVTTLSHPSLQGIQSGTGLSGSTSWHGAFRYRQYLKGTKAENGEQADSDLREFEFKKNQYGPTGEKIVLRYQHGLFLPVVGVSDLEKAEAQAKAEHTFLEMLRRFAKQGRNVSNKPKSNSFAPTEFAQENPEFKKSEIEAAMHRLFAMNKLRVEPYGKPSREWTRIAEMR